MTKFAPNHILSSIIDDWAPYYVERTRAMLEGKWQSQDVFDGLAKGKVKMGPYVNMPPEVKKLAEETEAAIISGKLDPFMCPSSRRTAKPWNARAATAFPTSRSSA